MSGALQDTSNKRSGSHNRQDNSKSNRSGDVNLKKSKTNKDVNNNYSDESQDTDYNEELNLKSVLKEVKKKKDKVQKSKDSTYDNDEDESNQNNKEKDKNNNDKDNNNNVNGSFVDLIRDGVSYTVGGIGSIIRSIPSFISGGIVATRAKAASLYNNIDKLKDTCQSTINSILCPLWRIAPRDIKPGELNKISYRVYYSLPKTYKQIGIEKAEEIVHEYGMWTWSNVNEKIKLVYNDLKELLVNSKFKDDPSIVRYLDALQREIDTLDEIEDSPDSQKRRYYIEIFGRIFVSALDVSKKLENKYNNDGFDHHAFAKDIFDNTTIFIPFYPSVHVQELKNSIKNIVSENSANSIIEDDFNTLEHRIDMDYGDILFRCFYNQATKNPDSDNLPAACIYQELRHSNIFKKAALVMLVNQYIYASGEKGEQSNVREEKFLFVIEAIITSLFKNVYNTESLQSKYNNLYDNLKSRL